MFGFEENGYSKSEVDGYISKLKMELMEKKLSLLNSEQKVLDLTQKQNEIDQKEKNIFKALRAIEQANKAQEEGSKNLSNLLNKKNVLLEEKIADFIEFLKVYYPEIYKDSNAGKMINEINQMIEPKEEEKSKKLSENESMKILLNKVKQLKEQDEVKNIKIERKSLNVFDNAQNVDEFLATDPKTDQLYKNIAIESTAFDLKEAVNPKEDLDEIMKAFDFFGNNEE